VNHLKSLLVAVAVGMAGVAAWLLYEAISLHAQNGEQKELAELPQPSAELTYDDVVRIQLDALKNNDEFDTGIVTAFNFASPRNRLNYAPRRGGDESDMLRRFSRMLHSPHFRFILNHVSAELSAEFATEDEAWQYVTLKSRDGEEVVLLFLLRRQSETPFEGCWMTEGVEIFSRRPPRPQDEPVVEA
jgi:hypothetical protein